MKPELIVVVVFLSTILFVLGVAFAMRSIFSSRSAAVKRRFEAISAESQPIVNNAEVLSLLKKEQKWKDAFNFSNLPFFMNLPLLTEQAGLEINLGNWMLLSGLAGGGLGFVVLFYLKNLILAVGLGACIFLFPYLLVFYKRNQRIRAFEMNFSQTLDIISRSLRAGHPFTVALQMVAQELPDPINTEFSQVFREQQMGLPLDESLRGMVRRVPLIDLRFFVLTIVIHKQTGGDLSEVLENLSRVIRVRFQVLGQVKALTAEGRLSGWVLCALPFIVFFLITAVNPNYLDVLLNSDLGRKMLYGAGFMQVLGMFIIRKIVNIKV